MTYQGDRQLEALGDTRRREIVAILSEGPSSVGALAAQLPVSRPAVSQHLRVLKEAGLVRSSPEGTRRVYSLHPAGLAEIRAFLDHFWADHLSAYALAVTENTTADQDPDHPNEEELS